MLRKANLVLLVVGISVTGCFGKDKKRPFNLSEYCAKEVQEVVTGSQGSGLAFQLDPMSSSGDPFLSPTSNVLDSFRKQVTLDSLTGRGVLEGIFVSVLNGINCYEGFGAQDNSNQFNYPHSDPRFQEVMAYYYGSRFRKKLSELQVSEAERSLQVVVDCFEGDNAYYVRYPGVLEKVCMGDSVATEGADYSDDASVLVHEIQHAVTANHYHPTKDFNQFWYDEAGAINEGLSDVMAMIFLAPEVHPNLDPKVFSRWALGTFFPGEKHARGVHKCTAYSTDFPVCGGFSDDPSDFSNEPGNVNIYFSYPDGLGWPYYNNMSSGESARTLYEQFSSKEAYHVNGVILAGAIWDAYESIRDNHSGIDEAARNAMVPVILNAVRSLPQPSSTNKSPITMRGLASLMVQIASISFSTQDLDSMKQAFKERGLYDTAELPNGWAAVGAGTPQNPGFKVVDAPNTLKLWISNVGGSPNSIPQAGPSGINGKLNPGEVVALWFDVEDTAYLSAGGVMVTATSLTPGVTFLGSNVNFGYLSDTSAQVLYYKINGTGFVNALSNANPTYNISTGNSYFKTNPSFDQYPATAFWVKADSSVPPNSDIVFQVKLDPTNGPSETVTFTLR